MAPGSFLGKSLLEDTINSFFKFCEMGTKFFLLLDKAAFLALHSPQVHSNKPMTRTSTRDTAFPRELPAVEWQQRRPRRMDRRGRTERRKASKDDGLFPRYQGKTCVSTSPSGRAIAKLGGTAEVFRLLSQGTIG